MLSNDSNAGLAPAVRRDRDSLKQSAAVKSADILAKLAQVCWQRRHGQ